MKTLLTIILSFCLLFAGLARQVTRIEYSFDTDPGVGNGIMMDIPDGTDVSTELNIPVGGLPVGFHKLYMRIRDENGVWSHTQQRIFYVEDAGSQVTEPEITEAEILIDTETGYRTGQKVDLTDGDTSSQTIDFDISGLEPGFHKLLVRVKDDRGRWSHTSQKIFFVEKTDISIEPEISGSEYFIDTDPGPGNGSAFNYTAKDSLTSIENVSVAGLSPGWHYLGMRVKDTRGSWSMPIFRKIFIDTIQLPAPQSYVADKIEWWIDELPAQGTGNLVDTEVGDSSEIRLEIPLSAWGTGLHRLYTRYHSTSGLWSAPESRTFYMQSLSIRSDTSATSITRAEYFFDTDPGFGNGYAIPVDDSDTLERQYMIPIDGLSQGIHTLYIRIQNNFGYWTSLESRHIYIQGLPEPPRGTAPISRAEFFIGDDPGAGKATPMVITPGDSVSINQVHDISTLNLNQYYKISYRFGDSLGNWSVAATDSFIRVDCDIPEQPLKPGGQSSICSAQSFNYSSELPAFGDSLIWDILETELIIDGTISLLPSGLSVQISFNEAYSGKISLIVKAINECISGPWSEPLVIEVTGITELPGEPFGIVNICSGEVQKYYPDTSYGDVTYEWDLSPASAGVLTQNLDTASIAWADNYHGEATLRYRYNDGCAISEYSPPVTINITGPEILPAPEGDPVICEGANGIFTLPGFDSTIYSTLSWISIPSEALNPVSLSPAIMQAGWSLSGIGNKIGLYVEAMNKCGRTNLSDTLWLTSVEDEISLQIDLSEPLTACASSPSGFTIPVQNFSEGLTYHGEFYPDSAGSVSFSNGSYNASWNQLNSYPDSVKLVLKAYGYCEDTVHTDTSIWINFVSHVEALEFTAPDSLCTSTDSFLMQIITQVEADSFEWSLSLHLPTYTSENYVVHPGFNDANPGDYQFKVRPINECGLHPTGFTRDFNIKQAPAEPTLSEGPEVVCASDLTVYLNTTWPSVDAYDSYSWNVLPAEAGSLTEHKDSLIIKWNESFEGTVSVSVSGLTNCGLTSNSNIQAVDVHANIINSMITGDTLFCPDETASFRLVPSLPFSTIRQWTMNPVIPGEGPIDQEVFQFTIPRTELPETSEVRLEVNNACESPVIEPLLIHLNQYPQVEEILGSDTICVADTAIYSMSNMQSYLLNWDVEGITEFDTTGLGGMLRIFNPQPEENITINLIYTDLTTGCSRSRQMDAAALPSPVKAEIVKKGNRILIYKDIIATEYQWYFNDNSVPGETGQFYAPDTLLSGEYFVIAKNPEGCLARSDVYLIADSKKSDIAAPTFKLVPNPAISQFRLIFDEYFEGEIRIQVFDSRSRIWHDEEVELQPSSISNFVELDASNWDHGIYFIRVIRDGIPFIEKLIIM